MLETIGPLDGCYETTLYDHNVCIPQEGRVVFSPTAQSYIQH